MIIVKGRATENLLFNTSTKNESIQFVFLQSDLQQAMQLKNSFHKMGLMQYILIHINLIPNQCWDLNKLIA